MRKRTKITGEMMGAAMEAVGLKYRLAENPDSPELNAELNETVLRLLTAELDAGKITQAEYDRAVATLRETGWRSVFTLAMGFVFRR
jgi:hypothetical protein